MDFQKLVEEKMEENLRDTLNAKNGELLTDALADPFLREDFFNACLPERTWDKDKSDLLDLMDKFQKGLIRSLGTTYETQCQQEVQADLDAADDYRREMADEVRREQNDYERRTA